MKYKTLEYNDSNRQFVESCKKVYLVGLWARYGVREYAFAGEYVDSKLWGKEPLVWLEDDHNGTYCEYICMPITETTTGESIVYSFDKDIAESVAQAYNEVKNLN